MEPEPPRKRQRRPRGASSSPRRPRLPRRPSSSPRSLSAPIFSGPLREIFGTRNPEARQNQDFLAPGNQNQERGEANQNGHDEGLPGQENQGFGAAMNGLLLGNFRNPVQENRIILGFSSTAGINVLDMINAFAAQFAGVRIVATDHAMNFLYRHATHHHIYTDEDSLSYVRAHHGFELYVELCSWATHICVFANASTCSKLGTGNFDDLLTTIVSNFGGNVHIVPVMTPRQRMSMAMHVRFNDLLVQGFWIAGALADTATLVNWVLGHNAAI